MLKVIKKNFNSMLNKLGRLKIGEKFCFYYFNKLRFEKLVLYKSKKEKILK